MSVRLRYFAATLAAAAACIFCGAAAHADGTAVGGGYAVTGQLDGVGYAAKLYNAESGLPTSDANCIMSSSDGYIWIGGYSGVIKYDGTSFERLNSAEGLTSARILFEDSKGRIWAGTNDNGVVVIDGEKRHHYTYEDGLASSSVRGIAEGSGDIVYIGLAKGIAYIGDDMILKTINDERVSSASVRRLVSDTEGRVFGSTRSGEIFCLENGEVTSFTDGERLLPRRITTVYADPEAPGTIYLGTDGDKLYRAVYNGRFSRLHEIDVGPLWNIGWITRACGKIWINTDTAVGWLDDSGELNTLSDLPMNNGIEMMTPDYQGNLWFASTRQGVMKLAASSFRDINELSGMEREVVNATCLCGGMYYIGTDKGLRVLDSELHPVENELTDYIGDKRVRCITEDNDGVLWLGVYADGMGLVSWSPDGKIGHITESSGLADDLVRCATLASDGSLLVGTNGGITIIRGGVPVRSYDARDGMENTVVLTVEEGLDGTIYAGTDGGGIYAITDEGVRNIGRADGLTSDVILRIKKDGKRGVLWMITSNSIEYMRDGVIRDIPEFPYNNNFDLYFGSGDDMWILSSYGIYRVSAPDMLDGGSLEHELCGTMNGLPCIPTANAFSGLDENGDLYIAGRSGVSAVNIYRYSERTSEIKLGIRSLYCDDTEVLPDEHGTYTIPASPGRIQIKAAVLDYTLSDPSVRMWLEGGDDTGITANRSQLTALEFTGLRYGDYTLHIQILDDSDGSVFEDRSFRIVKQPHFFELLIVRIIGVALLVLAAGFIVWRVMTNTIIRRQYEQIRAAKEEAERANSAKSRFLANMSHEIRTPINTIMGMDEMILREDAEGVPDGYFKSVSDYAADIKSASESLLGLVNDLLDMSKIESGKMHLVEQEYDVTEMLRAMTAMIRVRSSQKGLSFDTDIDGTVPKRLYGDVGKIKQVVLNLLTNAVKYTETGGFTLGLRVTDRGEDGTCGLRFSVKDTGIGVKQEDMEKLFTAYERLDEEKNSGIQGTGLGLDISRRFAELMNGSLWCESVYGEGSEFILTLRQRIVDGEGIGQFTEHSGERSKGKYIPLFTAPDAKVLVTDDNPMNLTVVKGLLKAVKVQVTTAAGGEECLELLGRESFHIVFLDHMMPGMDGLETVARIRETMPELPVYALTANITSGGEEFYKSKGFDGCLTKPIDSQTLERTIMERLPKELIHGATESDAVAEEPEELPGDMEWLKDTEGISVPEGIKNSGGVSSFIYSLKMFLETTDSSSKVIEDAYDSGDIRLYTVKVHALKSSARIIGASELSALAQELENAGNSGDMEFIDANTGRLLEMHRGYKEKLARLAPQADAGEREPIPQEELDDAYSALKEVIPQMDYDAVEMIVGQLKEYRLPEGDAERIAELERMLRTFDWDGMEELINKEL